MRRVCVMVAAGGVVWCWSDGRWLPLQLTSVQLSGAVTQEQLDAVRDLLQNFVLPADASGSSEMSAVPLAAPKIEQIEPKPDVAPKSGPGRWEGMVAESAPAARYRLGDPDDGKTEPPPIPPPPPRAFKHKQKQPCRQPHKCTISQARLEWHQLINDGLKDPPEPEVKPSSKNAFAKVSLNVMNLQKFYRLVKQRKTSDKKKSKKDSGLHRSDSDSLCHDHVNGGDDVKDGFRSFRKNRTLSIGNTYSAPRPEQRYSDEPRNSLLARCRGDEFADARRYSDPPAATRKQREAWARNTRKLSDSSLKDM